MKVSKFIDKYVYNSFSETEKIMYLEGTMYPDECYLEDVASENNIRIIW